MEWNELDKLLDGDTEPEELVDALTRIDDRDRRALSKPLAAHLKQWWPRISDVAFGYDHSGVPGHERRRRRRVRASAEAVRLSVAGVCGDARSAAGWLVREAQHPVSPWRNHPRGRELRESHRQTDRLNRVGGRRRCRARSVGHSGRDAAAPAEHRDHPQPAVLMELAARVADTVHARGRIPAVAEAADRRGSSKLVKQAKRLRQTLTR